MRVFTINGRDYRLPSVLNTFQQEMYVHLINWKWQHITAEPGTDKGIEYDAILPDSYASQYPVLYPGIRDALLAHYQKYPFRIHKYFNHMASSQAANINLFLPILHHPKVDDILREIKPDLARLATDQLDQGYRIEFWDEPHGSLGDKTDVSGTDADLAIAYYNRDGAPCLWLIEHKLTEDEFTKCGGFKSRGRQPRHDCGKSYAELIANPSSCYYHDVRQFNYWNITVANADFFVNHAQHTSCPFCGGMNQLWRNMLLALAVEQDGRQPHQLATFSVVCHPGNSALDRTISAFRHLTGDNAKFTTFTSADVIAAACVHADDRLQAWIDWYRELYNV